jgi:hypothetical protein
MKISLTKTKVSPFKEKYPINCKVMILNSAMEQVLHFKYLISYISYEPHYNVINKIHQYQGICGMINRPLK